MDADRGVSSSAPAYFSASRSTATWDPSWQLERAGELGVVWATVAFLLGTILWTRTTAAIGAAAALLLALISYYAAVATLGNVGFSERGLLVWSVGGLIAGAVFGLAGRLAVAQPTRPTSLWQLGGNMLQKGRTCCGSSATRCCAPPKR
jgi:hypothetical protein